MAERETTVAEVADHRGIKVFIDDKSYVFADDDVTGRDIKAKAGIPESYSLYLRRHGSNEPIRDDEVVELKEGEHFFSRPPSNVS
jgi:hypothetical protein